MTAPTEASWPTAPCPHCGGQGRVSPDPLLRHRCELCGGPRIPPAPDGTQANRETPRAREELARANGLRQRALAARVGGFAALVAGSFGLLVAIASSFALDSSAMKAVLFALLAFLPFGAAFGLFARGRSQRSALTAALGQAWGEAALAELSTGTPLTSAQLAGKLRVAPAEADALLQQLHRSSRIRVDVSEGGDLLYEGAESAPAPVKQQVAP